MTDQIAFVHYNRLRVGTKNPRIFTGLEQEEIRDLAKLIALHGLLVPLRVAPDDGHGHEIIAGQRRYRAIGDLWTYQDEILAELEIPWTPGVPTSVYARMKQQIGVLYTQVPVIIDASWDREGVAMVDNLGRSDLSHYEIAREIHRISEARNPAPSGAEIARRIGRSPAYVSRALKAWRNAGELLQAAWRAGEISYDQVKKLADLPVEEQDRLLTSGKHERGGYGRPGVESVKATLEAAAKHFGARAQPQSYASGVIDALRWATGQTSSATFAEFIQTIEEG